MALATHEHRDLARAVIPIAHRAGLAILGHYAEGVGVAYKADRSPVTAADHEAEAIILEGLASILPQVPIVAEEEAAAGRLPDISGRRFFLVDPLDGTKEFIKGNGEFTVNIALIEGDEPVFGLVYAPAFGAMYATLGDGHAGVAKCNADGAAPKLDAFRALRTREPPGQALVAITSRSHQTEATRAFLAGQPVASTRLAGSSLKFGLIAEGQADVYPRFGPTWEWDTAAGHAILKAAGGDVVGVDGAPFRYGKVSAGFLNPGFIAWGRAP